MINTKKDLLFIMNNLNCGGAEKALISLLQSIDYSKYNVDLLLFKKEGLFLNQVPKEVIILAEPKEYIFFDMSIKKAIFQNLILGNFNTIYNRICAGFILKKEKNRALAEQKMWRYLGSSLKKIEKEYDLAVGFLEKTPNYFCVDKVCAKKKIGFIHNDYEKLEMDSSIDIPFFDALDSIATISEECLVTLKRCFPKYSEKCIVINNISSPKLISKLALEPIESLYSGLKLVTIGRLSPQKGYDLLVDAAKQLKDRKIDFRWYILGIGALQNQLEELINENGLNDNIIFLGLKENPYPYIEQCDIYIQPSRFEGKSVAIDEAKILQKAIIVTNFSTAKDQIINEVTGLIVEMNGLSLAEGILRLESDANLKNQLIYNLSNEANGNEDEVEKIYQIMN